ncbi:hypothetical protein A2767_02440 [Candidatus Roizmanbacteria bacterium RIFCSPHIGHO2_01_FULL_35_10]|uniref:MIP18 family-like domain-containing protein n=1 Tax=Candidatus Roizmanbacteria bacterium RIFCSPLOWO2_01_FULL_35_13 TaxID=1802055 RepID=A0A1F7IB13_9BACT|nr:MAG: hypothetical protein A2767_02440 [Candidatus Roizmanbacteria bacterium RIFCSPHIGHO2_01_FULL_35_10]OGK40530.1 MAG: hypothetical protein A3A74_02980 [Candidatus Roizmanbacteria bacterium RIFCSPLOWO2_01_FULL_35_13]
MQKITEKLIKSKLTEVLDPELNISIVDLGLVYKVEQQKSGNVVITMTLTTIGCPLFSTIEQEIKSKLKELGIVEKKVKLNLTFDPPWSMEKMSERAKALLGI